MLSQPFPRLVIGGVASGVGKTTVTVALARALRNRGLRVTLFKCGPDYLDPTYHTRAVGTVGQNLDGWMMGQEAVRSTFIHSAKQSDVSLIEGVMGLFDSASATSAEGSTAEIAKWLAAPVCLVVDAGGMARSIAALIAGYTAFDPEVRLAGAIANRVGSRGHLDILRQAARKEPILGGLPRDPAHAFPERHLGLHSANESVLPEALLEHWATQANDWFDIERLLEIARSAPPVTLDAPPVDAVRSSSCRIGIAQDAAFHFYYADNLRQLENCGATLVPFSPLHDGALPDVDGLYLGGGYPELAAAALSANHSMRSAVARFAANGGPIYAECGGLMYLTQAIETLDGQSHAMVGLLPSRARMCEKLQALGYAEVETQVRTILGEAGTRFRGHQFRYSELSPPLELEQFEHAYSVRRRRGNTTFREGYRQANVVGSYVHAHWASNPQVPEHLVASCTAYAREQVARGSKQEPMP